MSEIVLCWFKVAEAKHWGAVSASNKPVLAVLLEAAAAVAEQSVSRCLASLSSTGEMQL